MTATRRAVPAAVGVVTGATFPAAAHRQAVEATLAARGLDLGAAYVALDAQETLNGVLVRDAVDADLFDRTVGRMVRGLVAEGRPVRIYGEMVGLLWAGGDVVSAMRLETAWNELRGQVPFTLHCGYGMSPRDDHAALEALCRLHGATVEADPVTTVAIAIASGSAEPSPLLHPPPQGRCPGGSGSCCRSVGDP